MNAEPVIEVNNLSAVFSSRNGGLRALDRVTFKVIAQEFVCIVGPSGGGKSTLLRILAGLMPATEGEVYIHGDVLKGPKREVGFVFQNPNLMPWRTVVQNLMLPLELNGTSRDKAEKNAREMVELIGLVGFEGMLPRDLSGGMAQRVAIGRALVHDPDVLLLDEPFGALDALTRERMGLELLRIWQAKRKTVVMVTHSIQEALFLADRVLVLSSRPGRIRLDLDVEFPRPRREEIRYTEQFSALEQKLRSKIGEE